MQDLSDEKYFLELTTNYNNKIFIKYHKHYWSPDLIFTGA